VVLRWTVPQAALFKGSLAVICYSAAPMWCNERRRLQLGTGLLAAARMWVGSVVVALCVSAWVGAGSAAAQVSAPTLKVSGKASFVTEARATGDSYEVRATLVDEVGRPLPDAEIRVRTLSTSSAATLHRCGDPRGEAGGELLLTTDKSGRVCSSVTGMTSGAVELGFQDARGYLERATRVVRLPDGVATFFEIGFDPPVTTLSLDQPVQELGLVARARGGSTPPPAAELVLSMVADGSEQELARAALDGLGEVHRLSLVSSSFGHPGPARLVGRLRAHEGEELAQVNSAIVRNATVTLSVEGGLDVGVEPGAKLQLHAASVLGPAASGIVEARSRGRSVAAARIKNGVATLSVPPAPAAMLGGTLTLEYVGEGAGWLPGPPLELRVLAASPGYARYAFWIVAAGLAALAVVLGWRRPPRPRPQPPTEPSRVRASVEVLEPFGAGGGYQGHVRDAHEGTSISPAAVSFIGPGLNRPVLLQVRTATDGSFRIQGATFPDGTLVEVSAPFHATLTAPLPVPGVIQLSLISRRRALVERLVRWAERRGKPWIRPSTEPTPAEIAATASLEAEPEVERWARGLERLAFGPLPPDAASEQASGVVEDPKTTRERGID
jgi:hypothetical protein